MTDHGWTPDDLHEDDAALVEVERAFWERGDPAMYEEGFAEDGRCVFGFGVLDKATTVASMEGGAGWSDVVFDEVEVLHLHPQVRALVYLGEGTRSDGERYRSRVSSTYVERDGVWLLALHHQLPLQ